MTLLAHTVLGGLFCALVSALLAPSYGNNPVEVAIAGFFVGAAAQIVLRLLFVWLGWWQ